jgi:outer membrane receptor protein involved in Fe transport
MSILARSLLASAAISAMASFAKAEEQTSSASVGELVVTGSHIHTGGVAAVAPVQILDRPAIVATGAQQLSDLLSYIPSNTGSALENEGGALAGTAQFSLRGLGYSSTLTLVNGRRAGVSPLSDKSGDDFLDINQFPVSMIQRIDVLKNGASAIYGSEAVAGVVNIITRSGFDGIELSGDYASSTNRAYSLNLALGKTFDRGSISFYASYYNQTANERGDFGWLVQRDGGGGNPGLGVFINAGAYPGNFLEGFIDPSGKPEVVPGAIRIPDPGCQAAHGVFRITNGVANTTQCLYNFQNTVSPIPAESFVKTFLEARYQLTSHVTYFNETSFANNLTSQLSDPSDFGNGLAVGSEAGDLYVPAASPFNFFIADPSTPGGLLYVPPSQWNNSLDHAVPVLGQFFRPQGFFYYPVKLSQTNQYLRVMNGLDVQLPARWQASASYMWAQGENTLENPGNINAAVLNALTLSGQYDPFAVSVLDPTLISPKNGVSVAANSDALLKQFFYTEIDRRKTEQHVVDVSASGPLLDLPTGPLSAALGAQYRRQSLHVNPDTLAAAGQAASPSPSPGFSGREHVWAGYAEILAAVTPRADVQLALRYEDYGTGIGSNTSPKVSGRFAIFPNVLDIRGSWGKAFQAPTLTQDATTLSLQYLDDPVTFASGTPSCGSASVASSGTIVETTGGSLKPQKSTNYTVGFDATPVRNLQVTADYWHYNYSNLIAAPLNAQAIVNSECVNGQYVPNPNVIRAGATGVLSQVNTAFSNIGHVETDGVDVSAAYSTAMGGLGVLHLALDATYVNRFDVFGAAGIVSHDVGSRNFTNNFGPMPRWRGTAVAGWSWGPGTATLAVHYADGYRNDQSPVNSRIASFTTVDLQYRYDLAGRIPFGPVLSVGVSNLFDEDPPALIDPAARTGVDRPGYDPLGGASLQGRTVYVRLLKKF